MMEKDLHTDQVYFGAVEGIHPLVAGFSAVIIIADHNTATHCVPKIPGISPIPVVSIPAGEKYKSLDSCRYIWQEMIRLNVDRGALILNVGGGMICDLGGFASACFQRGIAFAHIPTSLLAMTDAAIGGKTGIDFLSLKNYLGVFAKPKFTWIDTQFLRTLPPREFLSGMAEILKHAVIASVPLWKSLETITDYTDLEIDRILPLSVEVKRKITAADFREAGMRKVLNFGHTLGHALESYYMQALTPLSHGEAVTLGMLGETFIANLSGILDNTQFNAIVKLIDRLLNPVSISLPNFTELKQYIDRDKKASSGSALFSLPDAIGSCRWDIHVNDVQIMEALQWLSAHVKPGEVR